MTTKRIVPRLLGLAAISAFIVGCGEIPSEEKNSPAPGPAPVQTPSSLRVETITLDSGRTVSCVVASGGVSCNW